MLIRIGQVLVTITNTRTNEKRNRIVQGQGLIFTVEMSAEARVKRKCQDGKVHGQLAGQLVNILRHGYFRFPNSAYLIFANVSSLLKTLATDKLA